MGKHLLAWSTDQKLRRPGRQEDEKDAEKTWTASKAEYQGKMGPMWEVPYRVRKAYGDGAYKPETLSGEAID
ncbi:hypothetical protein Tco_0076799 [Tanacetum coccineum]